MGVRGRQFGRGVVLGFFLGLAFGYFYQMEIGLTHESSQFDNPQKDVGLFRTNSDPLSPQTKIFLVAGSSQNANFAQEILDQRRLWKSVGFRDDEIACYYIVPTKRQYQKDKEQYRYLSLWLPDCFPASAKLLREHILYIAHRSPEFFYLYVTSHGKKPVTLELASTDPSRKKYSRLKKLSQYPVLDQYRLIIEALPEGPASEREILVAYQKGADPRDLYFTPAYLREVLLQFPEDTPKIIVLQGCYSGGFIEDYQVYFPDRLLTSVPQLTLLTASRYDRTSFGCHPGSDTTYFGGTFNQVLSNYLGNPNQMDWKTLHEEVKERVMDLEVELEEGKHSLPMFFSNRK